MVDQYIFSGSLPEEATTYVTREADGELYEGLKAGKFCYVLNSRQSGKSSLRVRTMRRLRESGVECAAIDLSAGGIQNVPPEQWYADLIDTLIESFGLDVEFADWWSQNQLNSLVTRFRKFLEEILLAEIKENIVIFIDEIDSVLSLNFPTDDFFAFIRACYNQRVDNPEYNRLTFCLLGVASPSNLISDKKRTPFNIGKAISLKGFQLHEVEPLEKGLHGRYSDSQAVMKEILHWTGGQPFLTQKLCQFMVEESETDNPRTVEQVVKSHIIENWESQDEPEHLRTIRDRILRDEQRASYLLELYQQIRVTENQSEITADDTQEQSELQLSGLVVREQNKLRVYNPIYKEVFEQNWIETQLRNLRPYSENFKFWVASGGSDDSRLLRGKALQDALEWSRDKSLSYQDRQFLAASQAKEREEEIAALEKEAALERERKDREATEQRNQVLAEANQTFADANNTLTDANQRLADANDTLTEANKKAKRRIHVGSIILFLTLLGAVISGSLAVVTLGRIQEQAKNLSKLSDLSGELQSKDMQGSADEARRQLGLSYAIRENHKLQQALLLSGIAFAYQRLARRAELLTSSNLQFSVESQDMEELKREKLKTSTFKNAATEAIQASMKLLQEKDLKNSLQENEVSVYTLSTLGELLKYKNDNQGAIKAYTKAFNLLQSNTAQLTPFNSNTRILDIDTVEYIHGQLIKLLSTKSVQENDLLHQVKESFKEHYYAKLDNLLTLKQWETANELTIKLMIYITNLEDGDFKDTDNWKIDEEDLMKFPCRDLQKIDEKWRSRSSGRFGFGVQKQIWQETGNRVEYNWSAYRSFLSEIGWIGNQREDDGIIPFQVDRLIKRNRRGTLPHYEHEIHEYRGIMPIPSSHRITDLLNNDCEFQLCGDVVRQEIAPIPEADICVGPCIPPPPATHRILSRALVCKL